MRGRRLRLTLIWVAVTVAVLAGWPGQASAFDVGYHSDLTFEVLSREGFAADATGAAVVANYLDDGFESAKTVIAEASGILAPLGHAWGNLYGPASARDASDLYLHFDDLPGTAEVSAAWDRLVRNTRRAAQEAERRQDPAGLLSVLGASLHTVQDFYSHANWSNLDWGGATPPGLTCPRRNARPKPSAAWTTRPRTRTTRAAPALTRPTVRPSTPATSGRASSGRGWGRASGPGPPAWPTRR